MKSFKNLSKRALALFMALVMSLSLMQVTALAAEQVDAREADVVARYPSLDRDSAELTYQLGGVSSGVHLVCLWDKTAGNPAAAAVSSLLNRYSRLCWDSGTDAVSISYSYTPFTEEGLTGKFNGTLGEGQSNEVDALDAALREVESGTVVLWVPSTNLDYRRTAEQKTEIQKKLDALKEKIGPTGTLVIWQMADQPSKLLGKNARVSPANSFSKDVGDWLEAVLTDHIKDYTLTFRTTSTQGEPVLANSITSVTSNMRPANNNGDGTFTLVIPKLYDHQDLSVTVTVALNKVNPSKIVDVVKVDVDKEAGTHYSGLEDLETDHDLPTFPNGPADRVLRKITLAGGPKAPESYKEPKPLEALPGQLVVLPDVSDQNAPGAAFDWWSAPDGTLYKPGRALAMPENGMELTAQWGHVEVELHVSGVTAPAPVGNRMAESHVRIGAINPKPALLSFNGRGGIYDRAIASVKFETQRAAYTGVKSTGEFGTVLDKDGKTSYTAKFVGATPQDEVVAYAIPTGERNSYGPTYDMVIAGEGGVTAPESCTQLFVQFSGLTTVNLTHLDTSNTTDMSGMFYECSDLTSLILPEDFDTSHVTNMSSMFYWCWDLPSSGLDASKFDTSNVEYMGGMFMDCHHLTSLDLSSWNTSKVKSMYGMFSSCTALSSLNVNGWDTSNVTDMSRMFYYCQSLGSSSLAGVKNWDTSNVKYMDSMFSVCQILSSLDLGGWDTSNVTNMSCMFNKCIRLSTLNLSGWDTSNVTDMRGMFSSTALGKLDLSHFDTTKVTNMAEMFQSSASLSSLNLSQFNTSNVTTMGSMFSGCSGLTELDVSNFSTEKVISMSSMFSGCRRLTKLGVSNFNTEKVTNMGSMFSGCSGLTELDVSNFNTEKVTNMGSMFSGCSGLTELDVGNFNTQKVALMSSMFRECSGLTSLDVSSFDTQNVTNMSAMFAKCGALNSLTFSEKWDTSKVSSMQQMFTDCSKLTSLDFSEGKFILADQNFADWNYSLGVKRSTNLFDNCTALTQILGIRLKPNYNYLQLKGMFCLSESHGNFKDLGTVTFIAADGGTTMKNLSSLEEMFKGCSKLREVDLSGWSLPDLSNVSGMFRGCKADGLTINMSWSKLDSTNDMATYNTVDSDGSKTKVNLIVGTDYTSGTSERHKQQMKAIIDAFQAQRDVQVYATKADMEANNPVGLTTNPVTPAYTVETWLEDQTEAAKTETVEYTEADVVFIGEDTTATTYTIPTVKGYDFDHALSGGSEEHLTVEDTGDRMTVTFPVAGDPETDVLKLYYTPKMVWYTVEYYVDGEINDGLTESFAVKDGEEINTYRNKQPDDCHLEKTENLPLTVTDGGDNVIRVYYAKDVIVPTYTVEYYYDGKIDDSQTVNTSEGVVMDEDGTASVTYTVVPLADYTMEILPEGLEVADGENGEKLVTLPLTADGENRIQVYYTKVVATPARVQYTVEYYVDGKMDDSLTETLEAEDGTAINGYPDHCQEGWHPEKTENLPLTVTDGEENIIRVYYVQNDQEGGTDDSALPEDSAESGAESGEEGGEALSLARSTRNQRMKVTTDPVTGAKTYEEEDLVGENPNYSKPIVTAIVPTPKDSELTYKVVVKYTGDDGVRSGRIDIRYPLPEGVKAAENPKITIGGSGSNAASIEKLKEFELDESGRVLTGAISGLYAGTEYEVSINCVLETLNEPVNEVYYWDGTAYAQTSNEAVSSNIMRLWWQKDADPVNPPEPPVSQDVAVKYQFLGQKPENVNVPKNVTVTAGDPVPLPDVEVPEGYKFDGWYKLNSDGTGTKMETENPYQTTDADVATGVTLYGRWTRDPEATETVTVHYVSKDGPAGLSVPKDATVILGETYTVVEIARDAYQDYYYTFNGWKLGENGEIVTDIDTSSGYKNGQTITLYASWEAWKGTITFDGNDATSGSMADQEITLGNPENLDENKFVKTDCTFQGWSTTKDGNVEYLDKASAAGLVDRLSKAEGRTITLYAVWEQNTAKYTVEYYYDDATEPGETPEGNPKGGSGRIGDTTAVTAREKVTTAEGETAKHYALDYIEQVELKAGTNNVVKVYYAADEKGKDPTKPSEPGDGIPDKYQATLIYRLDGNTGTWEENYLEAGETEKTVVVTLAEKKLDGAWSEPVTVPESDRQIPEMTKETTAKAAADYQQGAGTWTAVDQSNQPLTGNTTTPDKVNLEVKKEYIFRWAFTRIPAFDVRYHLNGGKVSDKTDDVVRTIRNADAGETKIYANDITPTREGAVFAGWTIKVPEGEAVNKVYTIGEKYPELINSGAVVSDVKEKEYYAVWSANEDAGKGDKTPDIFQAKVTYKVVGGTWSSGKEATYTDWHNTLPATLSEVTGTPNPEFGDDPGTWTLSVNGADATASDGPKDYGIAANNAYEFTLTYSTVKQVSYTVVKHYRNAAIDKKTSEYPDAGFETVPMDAVDYNTELGKLPLPKDYQSSQTYPANGGKTYIFDSTATTYTLIKDKKEESATAATKLTATARIDLYYDVDNWSEKPGDGEDPGNTPDGKADKYQVLVKFEVAEKIGKVTGTGSVEPTSRVYALKDSSNQNATRGQINISATAKADPGSALAFWNGPDNFVCYEALDRTGVQVMGGSEYTYTATFLEDKKGGTDPEKPGEDKGDGIPDEYEAFVKFKASENGNLTSAETVGKEDVTTITRAYDLREITKNEDTGTQTLKLKNSITLGEYVGKQENTNADVTAVADEKFAFNDWKLGEDVIQAAAIKMDGTVDTAKKTLKADRTLPDITAGETYTYTASFLADEKGTNPGTPEESGDDIPDEYQVTVTYKATEGGRVTVGTAVATPAPAKDIVLYLPVVGDDKGTLTQYGTVTFPEATAAADTTPVSYSFVGWNRAEKGEEVTYLSTDATFTAEPKKLTEEDLRTYTFTAYFARNTYTVQFQWYTGTGGTVPAGYPAGDENGKQTVESGEGVTKPAKPTADGYEFLGWYTKTGETLSSAEYNFDTPVNADLILYAALDFLPQLKEVTKTAALPEGQDSVRTKGTITYTVKITPEPGKGEMASFKVDDIVSDGGTTNTKTLIFGEGEGKIQATVNAAGSWDDAGTTYTLNEATTDTVTLTYSITVDKTYSGWTQIANAITVTPISANNNEGDEKPGTSEPVPYTKQITSVTKVLTDELPLELTENKIQDGKLTLHYTITVKGDKGATFTISEDADAKIIEPSGWTADQNYTLSNPDDKGVCTMTFTATKDFTVENGKVKVTDEKLSNTVTVTPVGPGTEKKPTNPDDKPTETVYQVSYMFKDGVAPEGATLPKAWIVPAGSVKVDATYEVGKTLNGYKFLGWKNGDDLVSDTVEVTNKNIELVGTWEKLDPTLDSVVKTVTQIDKTTDIKVKTEGDKRVVDGIVVTAGNVITYQVKFKATEGGGLIKSFKLEDKMMSNPAVTVAGRSETGDKLGKWTDNNIYTLTKPTAAEITVTYTYEVKKPADGKTVSNTAAVTVWNGEPGEAPETPKDGQKKESTIDVPYGDPGLTVTKTVTQIGSKKITTANPFNKETDKVYPGQTITWLITVTNSGGIPLSNIKVTDTLTVPGVEAEVEWKDATPDDKGQVTIDSLAAGAKQEFEVSYTLPMGYKPASDDGKITNAAAAAAGTTTDEVKNPEEIPTARQAVSIKKEVSGAVDNHASVGGELTYTITVTNKGNVDLADLTLTDTFTGRGDDPRAGGNGYTFTASGKNDGAGTFTILSLAKGGTLTITYTYTVDAEDAGKQVTNTVVVPDGSQVQDVEPEDPANPDGPTKPVEEKEHKTTTDIYAQATVVFKAGSYGTFANDQTEISSAYTVATDGGTSVRSPEVTPKNNCKLAGWVATSDEDGWSYEVEGDSVNVKLSELEVEPGKTYTFTAQYKLDVENKDVAKQLQVLFPIEVSCEKADTTHHAAKTDAVAVTFESGIVKDGKVAVTAKVMPEAYAGNYKPNKVNHTANDTEEITRTVELTLKGGEWTGNPAGAIEIVTNCDVKKPTVDPNSPNPKIPENLLDADVIIKCIVEAPEKTHGQFSSKVRSEGINLETALEIGEVRYDETGTAICTVAVKPDQYIEKFNGQLSEGVAAHELYPSGQTWTIDLLWNGDTWTVKEGSALSKIFTVANDAKDITEFKTVVGGKEITGAIDGNTITITVPHGSNLEGLTPEIEHNGVSITPDGGAQDFSKPDENGKVIEYTVTAEDDSTKTYSVVVKVELPAPKDPDPDQPDPPTPPVTELGKKVVVDLNGGTWTEDQGKGWEKDPGETDRYSQTVESGKEIQLSDPTKELPDEHYRFDHWEVSGPDENGTVTYTAQYVRQYLITVNVENGTATVDENPVATGSTIRVDAETGLTVRFQANEGMALYTAMVGEDNVFADVNKGNYTFEKVTADRTITVVYSEDSLKETKEPAGPDQPGEPGSKTGGDGIADRYQVLVEFVNGDPDKGSLSGTTVQVHTLTNEDGTYATSGKITVSDSGVTKTGTGSYHFGQWTPALGEIDVEGGKAYIYTASWRAGTHTVTWVDYDRVTVLREVTVADDQENPPASDCPTPTRASDGVRRWTFNQWLVSTDSSGNVTYTAQYRGVLLRDDDDTPGGGGGGTGGNGGNNGTGGGNGTVIYDPEVPLGVQGLNSVDHFDYIKGYSDGTVRPEANITRAEVATIFFRLMTQEYRMANWATENSFGDVKSGDWFNNAVSTAAKAGILAGYPNGSFQPNKTITRAEFATIAARFASEAVPSGKMFSDIEGHWAQESIERASAAGWIRGNNGMFRPNDQITRAEVVTTINRMLDRIPDADHMLDGMKTFPDNTPDKWYYADVQEATNSHDYERDELGIGEIWTELLPAQEWTALEKEWATAADANINDVAVNLKEEETENPEESKKTEE